MSVPDVLSPQERLVLSLRGLYESYGYARFPMRRFEEYALYLENKSFLTSESVLSFTGASGQLMALRPDVTLSIVKRARPERRQVEKLYYHESVYRLSPTDHEFTEIGQLGVELLGEVDLYGAGEVLRLAIESLRLTGAGFVLDISHMGFAGGLFTVFLAMGVTARLDSSMENQTIILCGLVLSLFVNAILTVLTALSGKYLDQLIFWQMGSFSAQTYVNCAIMGIILLAGTVVLASRGTEMDLMTFGEEQAQAAGVALKKEKLLLIALSALLTGTAVSFAGVVGYVALISPHVTRRLFGPRTPLVYPRTDSIGGGFMVVADLAARTLLSPRELPVGAVTALIGAPFFAWIYFHKRGGDA